MKRCLIIGGGLSGLTAASILSSKNINVTLIESSPKLGGRTYSFTDKDTETEIDNGQHIIMGCYKETLELLNLIGAQNNFDYQKNLYLKFIDRNKNHFQLNASSSLYPFNLLFAVKNYDALDMNDKLTFILFLLKLPFVSKRSLRKISVKQWLNIENQSSNTINSFWEIFCVGALNTNSAKASALVFYEILMHIFFKGNFATTIILPKHGLNESIINPASSFIAKNGGKIISSETIKVVVVKNKKIVEVKSDENNYNEFDYVISAIPLHALEKIIPKENLEINLELKYSTILNIHIWLDKNNMQEKFYGLLNSPLHWIFVKEKHINIVISDADYLAEKSKEEIYEFVMDELIQYTSIVRDDIKQYKIIKEKRATFVPAITTSGKRPNSKTSIRNLLLAGDWTNTGLPSTIESAVKSGRIAAEQVLSEI
jgi:squalene-associated FAD-dependent desaturase